MIAMKAVEGDVATVDETGPIRPTVDVLATLQEMRFSMDARIYASAGINHSSVHVPGLVVRRTCLDPGGNKLIAPQNETAH